MALLNSSLPVPVSPVIMTVASVGATALMMLKNNKSEAFYEEVLKGMWGYLSDKFNIPVADLSKETSREALIRNNIDEELLSAFYYIIDNCEYARYSPEHKSEEMNKLYNKAVKTIIRLQQKLK